MAEWRGSSWYSWFRATSALVRHGMVAVLGVLSVVWPAQAQDVVLQPVANVASVVVITHAGDGSGRLFLVDRSGLIYIYAGGQLLPTPFLNITAKMVSGGESGLLGLAFHPNYAVNGYFFVNYTRNDGDTVVSRYQVSQDANLGDVDSELVLIVQDQPAVNHNGGQLQFGPDGDLYIGFGDGGGINARENGQAPDTFLGKILRIDVDNLNAQDVPPYDIPPDNPFVGVGGTLDEIWAFGLRNPWRFSFDRQTGDLYIADVGETAWEEVNFQPAVSNGGENYGWPRMEAAHCFSPSVNCNHNGSLTLPVYEYPHPVPGCASVTGGYVYRGQLFPQLLGYYFFGDYCSGDIWRMIRSGANWQVSAPTSTNLRITTFERMKPANSMWRISTAVRCTEFKHSQPAPRPAFFGPPTGEST